MDRSITGRMLPPVMTGTVKAAWIETAEQMPPTGVEVDTKIHDENGCRNEQPMVWQETPRGGLWFLGLEPGAMYAYYRPTHWRFRPGTVLQEVRQ